MLQTDQTIQIAAPLYQRLIDDNPTLPYEQAVTKTITLDEYYEDIRLNLEQLLNSRAVQFKQLEHYPSLRQSLLNYGTPDFTHHSYNSHHMHQQLCTQLKTIIQHFETRLTHVQVIMLDSDVSLKRSLNLRIEAEIHLRPTPANAVFEYHLGLINPLFTSINRAD